MYWFILQPLNAQGLGDYIAYNDPQRCWEVGAFLATIHERVYCGIQRQSDGAVCWPLNPERGDGIPWADLPTVIRAEWLNAFSPIAPNHLKVAP
jgi:hypothetical protein